MSNQIEQEDGSRTRFEESRLAEKLTASGLSSPLAAEVANDAAQWLEAHPREVVPVAALTNKVKELITDRITPSLSFLPARVLTPVAVGTPFFFFPDIDEIIRKFRDLLGQPSDIVFGPSSTGRRTNPENPDDPETVFKKWVRSCYNPDPDAAGKPGKHSGKTEEDAFVQDCPLKQGKYVLDIWNRNGKNIRGQVTLTWSYDCCNVYDLTVSGFKYGLEAPYKEKDDHEEPTKHFAFVIPTRSEPPLNPVKLRVCHPCVPKCLTAHIRVLFVDYEIGPVSGVEFSTRREINFDVKICAGGLNVTPNLTGTDGKSDKATAPGPIYKPSDDETWGVQPGTDPPNPSDG